MKRLVGVLLYSGFMVCPYAHGMESDLCLNDLRIAEYEQPCDATPSTPPTVKLTIEAWRYDDLLLMQVAEMTVQVYTLEQDDDRKKLLYVLDEYKKIRDLTSHKHAVYLRCFEIFDNDKKKRGLGKQLFLYSLLQVQKKHPQSVYFWTAEPLDGNENKARLFQFYKNCGATMVKEYEQSAIFYIDIAKLDLGIFKPQET